MKIIESGPGCAHVAVACLLVSRAFSCSSVLCSCPGPAPVLKITHCYVCAVPAPHCCFTAQAHHLSLRCAGRAGGQCSSSQQAALTRAAGWPSQPACSAPTSASAATSC